LWFKSLKKTGLDKAKVTTELFIKTDESEDPYIEGFITSLEKINFG